MAIEREDFIPGPAGPLEARVGEDLPDGQAPRAIAVCLHPHPLYQGTFDNKVVFTLNRAASSLGAYTVRFNFRGVGRSAGQYGEGTGELQDALAVMSWAQARWGTSLDLWLLGFSFGAGIGIRAARQAGAHKLVTVAPPVEHLVIQPHEIPTCPWLVIQGSQDEVVDPSAVEKWCARLVPPPELQLWPEVTHFFHGQLTALRRAVTAFLRAPS